MMFTKKRLLSLFLALVMVVSMIPLGLLSGNAEAASNSYSCLRSLQDLTAKFPSGKYWNHVGSTNNPDGCTDTPCNHYSSKSTCNRMGSAIQCYGFAAKLTYDYFGSRFDSWKTKGYSWDSLKPGDVIKNNSHYIWITAVKRANDYNQEYVSFADCNSDKQCKIRWSTMTRFDLEKKWGYTLIYVSPSSSTTVRPTKFYDVSSSEWSVYYVNYVSDPSRRLMNGVESYRFDLKGKFTYAQIATVLWNLSKNPDPNHGTGIYGSAWYAKAMTWGEEKGIFYNCPSHSPNANITRENFALVLYNFAKKMGKDISSKSTLNRFKDKSSVSKKAEDAMKWAVSKEIIGGSKVGNYNYLNPKSSATRAEVAKMLTVFHQWYIKS